MKYNFTNCKVDTLTNISATIKSIFDILKKKVKVQCIENIME